MHTYFNRTACVECCCMCTCIIHPCQSDIYQPRYRKFESRISVDLSIAEYQNDLPISVIRISDKVQADDFPISVNRITDIGK